MATALPLTGCGGTADTADSSDDADGGTGPTEVLTAQDLADLLVVPTDLGGNWQVLDDPFTGWPDGQPGAIPDGVTPELPTMEFSTCPAAGEEAKAAADIQWQAFTVLESPPSDDPATLVGMLAEVLYSGDAADIGQRLADTRDGMTACEPSGLEDEYPKAREELDLGVVGDEYLAYRDAVDMGDGDSAGFTELLVRRGTILLYVQFREYGTLLDQADLADILTTTADKLP